MTFNVIFQKIKKKSGFVSVFASVLSNNSNIKINK